AAIRTLRDYPHWLDAAADLDRVHLAQGYVASLHRCFSCRDNGLRCKTGNSYLSSGRTSSEDLQNFRAFQSRDSRQLVGWFASAGRLSLSFSPAARQMLGCEHATCHATVPRSIVLLVLA